MIIIRTLTKSDQAAYYKMNRQLDHETKYMMYEEGERPVSRKDFLQLTDFIAASGSKIFVAADGKNIVGIISAERGAMKRIRHVAYISIGILKDYRHQGIGTRLFEEVEKWAKESGITRLELTVMCHNLNAFALYQKAGFEVEGRRKRAMIVDGEYVDEYYMAKLLQ